MIWSYKFLAIHCAVTNMKFVNPRNFDCVCNCVHIVCLF